MLLDMLGILLKDLLNQTICCRVLFGDLSRMSRDKDLLEGGKEAGRVRMEGMGRGSQPIAIPWDENPTKGGMEGRPGIPEGKSLSAIP